MNFFITSLCYKNGRECPDRRTFGYYSTIEKSLEAVKMNRCNMHECLYNFLVIEEIKEGIHPMVDSEYWFEWKDKGWEQLCSKPPQFNGTCNWALG